MTLAMTMTHYTPEEWGLYPETQRVQVPPPRPSRTPSHGWQDLCDVQHRCDVSAPRPDRCADGCGARLHQGTPGAERRFQYGYWHSAVGARDRTLMATCASPGATARDGGLYSTNHGSCLRR